VVDDEKHRTAVDAAGKADADRLPSSLPLDVHQPLGDFVRQCTDVAAADLVEIRRQRPVLRREEARVGRVGIRTSHQLQLDDVVGRDHPGVSWMKLAVEPRLFQRPLQDVDPIRDEQRRTLMPFREEIAHRPIQRSRHADRDAVDRHERERSVDRANRCRIGAQYPPSSFVGVDIVQLIDGWIEQVHDSFDWAVHPRIVRQGHCGVAPARLRRIRTLTHSAPIAAKGKM